METYPENKLMEVLEQAKQGLALPELKEEQKKIILNIVKGNNCVGVLPTGFGKSVCFYLPPVVLNLLNPGKKHIAVVISPLKSLMINQEQILTKKGLRAVCLSDMNEEQENDVSEGNIDILFSSPEMIMMEKGKQVINLIKKNVCVLAFDESHCVWEWGEDFRPKYKEVSKLRSYITNAPVLLLTATTTAKIMSYILDTLMLKHQTVEVVALVPDRPNIRLNIKNTKRYEPELNWYIKLLRSAGKDTPKAIVYCRSLTEASEIYAYIMHSVGDMAWLSERRTPRLRIVDMYHSALLLEDQKRITIEFTKEYGSIRCVVATIAFGLGVDIPDLKYIFHWGPSKSPLQYWQEVGRCARNGSSGECFLYVYPRSLDPRRVDQDMQEICKSSHCLRVSVLEHLTIPGMDVSRLEFLRNRISCESNCTNCKCSLCSCCSRCSNACKCNKDREIS